MNFIALLIVALALFANLKSYKNVFMSKKKRKEAEANFEKAINEISETPMGKQITSGMMSASLGCTAFFNFLFYLITSIVVNNPIMYALAVVIFLLNLFGMKSAMKSMIEKKFIFSRANKLAVPLKTLYIIGFIALFFI